MDQVLAFIHAHPYATVAIAAAVGYLIGKR